MRERDERQHNSPEPEGKPYWREDLAIGEGRFFDEPYAIRLKLHVGHEQYRGKEELYPLTHKTGERIYLHARPYILVSEITLTVGFYDKPTETGVAGEVLESEWEGMRHQVIGNAQGWIYPEEHTAVLWECFLNDHWRMMEDPTQDENVKALWTGFEGLLLTRSPETERIVIPSWEDIYEKPAWQDFLKQQGYRPLNERAFLKEVAREVMKKEVQERVL